MFKDVCKCEFTDSFKIEADYHADPIWCNVCGWNLDIDDFPLSEELKDELFDWIKGFKIKPVNEFNNLGQYLTEKTIKELGSSYRMVFMPSK